jgi:hypothetical protein
LNITKDTFQSLGIPLLVDEEDFLETSSYFTQSQTILFQSKVNFQKSKKLNFFVFIFTKELAKFKLWGLIFIFGRLKKKSIISFESVLEVTTP